MIQLPSLRRTPPDPDQGDASVEFRAADGADASEPGELTVAVGRLLIGRWRRRTAMAAAKEDASP